MSPTGTCDILSMPLVCNTMVELTTPTNERTLREHSTFVTFHPNDRGYHEEFERRFGYFVNAVFAPETTRTHRSPGMHRLHLERTPGALESTLLVVLYGEHTVHDTHVSFDIELALSGSLGRTMGLMVLLLPSFPAAPFDQKGQLDETYVYSYLHPLAVENLESGYASLYAWPGTYAHPAIEEYPVAHAFIETLSKRRTHAHRVRSYTPAHSNTSRRAV